MVGRLAEIPQRGEIDRARNSEHVRVVNDRDLAEADTRLRDCASGDKANMSLPGVEHFDDFARRRLMDIDFDPRSWPTAALEGIGYQCLNDRVETGDANNDALAIGKLSHA